MSTTDKMSNAKLRLAIQELNEATKETFVVSSWEFGDNDKTQYGIMRKKNEKEADIILENGYTKREIYYHIQGYFVFNKKIMPNKATERPTIKKDK